MKCPGCQIELLPCGAVTIETETLDVYQCDDCKRSWDFDGESFTVALTFAVSSTGQLLDPETLDPLTLN